MTGDYTTHRWVWKRARMTVGDMSKECLLPYVTQAALELIATPLPQLPKF